MATDLIAPQVKLYFAEMGRKGGLATSPAKKKATLRNLKRAWAKNRKAKQ